MPWLRRLVAGLSAQRPGFYPGSVNVRFVVGKVALGQVFPPEYVGFPLSISPLHRKTKKLIISITGLHNKP